MKFSRILFKPKWQDADPAVRIAALASDTDPELVAALPELTRTDPDARVRLAALRRLGDYERWRERSTADPDASVRQAARGSYLALMCSGAANRPPLTRLIAELDTLSAAEIETVAATALDRDLRAAALLEADLVPLLVERATADPSSKVRQEAAFGLGMQPPDPRAAAMLAELIEQLESSRPLGKAERILLRNARFALKRQRAGMARAEQN